MIRAYKDEARRPPMQHALREGDVTREECASNDEGEDEEMRSCYVMSINMAQRGWRIQDCRAARYVSAHDALCYARRCQSRVAAWRRDNIEKDAVALS